MKKLLSLFLGLAITFSLSACGEKKEEQASEKPTIKIGVILPLTGNLSEIGENSKAAVEKIKSETKDRNVDFQIIVEDNNMDVKKTITAANKLITVDKVNAIVSAFTGPATAITQIANKNKILHICVANDCNVQSGELNFANWQHISVASKKVIELLKKHNAKKVVIFTLEDAGCSLVSENIRRDFEKEGIKFEEFRFNPSERDFSSIIDKATQVEDVDYWFLNTLSPAIELIRKQMILKNINIPITGIQTFGDAQDKSLFKGFEYVEAASVDEEIKKYIKEKTGSENVTVAAYIYDSVNMIIEQIEKYYKTNGKVPSSEEIARELIEMRDYNGAVRHVYIDPSRIMYSETVIRVLE